MSSLPAVSAYRVPVRAYALSYLALIAGILLLAIAVKDVSVVRSVMHTLVPFNWHVAPHDPNARDLHTMLSLWFHNARVALAPLALAAAVQTSPGRLRRTGDVLLAVVFALNVIPFAVDLGTWGSRLVPYIPNSPVELLALTIGPVSWWLVTRGRVPVRFLMRATVIAVGLLLLAACLETWAVA